MRKYARVEKVKNGFVIQIGGPGLGGPVEQWVAATPEEMMQVLHSVLEVKKTQKEPEGP